MTPRRIATGPDGSLWVAYYGNGRLARVDPQVRRVVKTWELPKAGGERYWYMGSHNGRLGVVQ